MVDIGGSTENVISTYIAKKNLDSVEEDVVSKILLLIEEF